ncbi:hypothetical protein B1B04_24800 [Lysinibacillus sp. KCTC 33748]|uniref:hypothetical protein n=1 Tax=unclassified Lysinibacillus TaxID=2636778 RepID=UPI0009A5C9C7|nr:MULTISPECIES: hypothetical protein [unclassified Lysinibacillus]OXS65761.1 hypothetical protein B1B04_24800 [Lysinibacillus sp. KCTC 33748]SKC19220.1 hypothetical protein SAMN06295926_1422 [Lysinibacillus sp. AC-3]
MATIGGNTEKKEIGLSIGVSGTHDKTMIDKTTGYLRLVDVDVDGQGNPVYIEQGSWTSDAIDLGDVFQDFEKVFTDNTVSGASSFAALTRVSDNGINWSKWVAIAEDGAIQSETKQYIQVRIDLFAGFVSDVFIIANSDFDTNKYIEQKVLSKGRYVVPKLTSNTSSTEGFPFSSSEYSSTYVKWKAFDKIDSAYFLTKASIIEGFLGFYFTNKKRITKYNIRSMITYQAMPKSWVLQASNDTTDGINGTWKDLDTQINQIWTATNIDKEYSFSNNEKYHAYRINWTENNGYTTYSGVGELDFYEEGTTSLSLKRDYQYDMTMDDTWLGEGSLHRQKITREEWLKIDRFEVK